MIQVKVTGSYNPARGDYDQMHSFESRVKDGFGGKMHTKVNIALKNFYKTYKLNPTISAMNIVMDDTNWVVKWEVLIEESKNGKAYIGLTSRGGAGPKEGPNGSIIRAETQYNSKILALKKEININTETHKILDFNFIPKIKGWAIKQIFAIYTNPSSYPPLPLSPKTTSGIVVNSITNQPIQGIQITKETLTNNQTNQTNQIIENNQITTNEQINNENTIIYDL